MRAREVRGKHSFMNEIAFTPSLSIKKSYALKIFGSNLILKDKKVEGMAEKQWTALCAVPVGASKISLCLNAVSNYRIARTYLTQNS